MFPLEFDRETLSFAPKVKKKVIPQPSSSTSPSIPNTQKSQSSN